MSIMIPHPKKPLFAKVAVPGSKSMTNRALILAALAQGTSLLQNLLLSEDSVAVIHALRSLGVEIELDPLTLSAQVKGSAGQFVCSQAHIDCCDAGTAMRFLLSICANQAGTFSFDGSDRLRQRPIAQLVNILRDQGASISADNLPLIINNEGHKQKSLKGGDIDVPNTVSSQFLSGLLLISPYCQRDVMLRPKKIHDSANVFLNHNMDACSDHSSLFVSRPYVDMTCAMMQHFGVKVDVSADCWRVSTPQVYQARSYWIEPDFSSASYFFAAAAVTAGEITLLGLSKETSIQGDKRFLDVLVDMGCIVKENSEGITVIGPKQLQGVTVDMHDFSDTMMTLAAIAPFASTPTRITHIGNTRVKESDRINAMATNLRTLGIRVKDEIDALTIYPGHPHPGTINAYNDHRIAMACSLLGLKVAGIIIDDEQCVKKTFPEFFDLFFMLL